jgi:hypothetical protein
VAPLSAPEVHPLPITSPHLSNEGGGYKKKGKRSQGTEGEKGRWEHELIFTGVDTWDLADVLGSRDEFSQVVAVVF